MTTEIDVRSEDRRPRRPALTPSDASPSPRAATPRGDASMRRLVRAAQAGDAPARDELARRMGPMALHWSMRLLGNAEDAQDVAQESLMRLFVHLDRFDTARSPWPWLRRIVTNAAVDTIRSRRRRELPWSSVAREEDDRPLDPVDPTVEPSEDRVDRRRRARLVRAAVRELPSHHRQTIELREFGGLSYRQIAERLDIPVGTVMSRLHAARRRLAELVAAHREAGGSARARRAGTARPDRMLTAESSFSKGLVARGREKGLAGAAV